MKKIDSLIKTEEALQNKERKFGSANIYFPAFLERDDGKKVPLLFTQGELLDAEIRARRNPEDISKSDASESFLHWIFGDSEK